MRHVPPCNNLPFSPGILAWMIMAIISASNLFAAETSSSASIESRARAILETHCLECHGGSSTKHDLDLKTRETLLKGGSEGPAIVPGKATESLLYKKITHTETTGMPYKREKLSQDEIATLTQWI